MVTRIAPGYPTSKKQVRKKYIKIPKYAPLYAMVKCNGPTTAPIKTPIAVPVEIIGELLAQKFNTPEIYEVVPIDIGHGKYTTPVRLTLENYQKSYGELIGPVTSVEPPVTESASDPIVTEPVKESIPEQTPEEIEQHKREKFESYAMEDTDVTVDETPQEETTETPEPEVTAEEPVVETTPEEDAALIAEASCAPPIEVVSEPNVTVIPSEEADVADTMAEYTEPAAGVTEVDVIPKTETEETINYSRTSKKKRNRHK